MMRWIFFKLLISICLIPLTGCWQSEYTKTLKSELGRGVRYDSVFLGINLGESRQLYQEKCSQLNKDKVLGMGARGGVAHRFLLDSSDSTQLVEVLVLPNFDKEDNISHVALEYSYVAWAPWNKQLQGDSLHPRLMKYLLRQFGGNKFIQVDADDNSFWVKIDGNRRIVVAKPDANQVTVKVYDMLHPFFKP
jgi:hypothetical protein